MLDDLSGTPLPPPPAFGRRVCIGRDSKNDIVLPEHAVSRFHAEMGCDENGCYIRDLGSVNNTYVNGQKIETAWLQPGDIIQVGNSAITYFVERLELMPVEEGWMVPVADTDNRSDAVKALFGNAAPQEDTETATAQAQAQWEQTDMSRVQPMVLSPAAPAAATAAAPPPAPLKPAVTRTIPEEHPTTAVHRVMVNMDNSADWLQGEGITLLKAEKFQDGLRWFQALSRKQPQLLGAYLGAGAAKLALKDTDGGLELLSKGSRGTSHSLAGEMMEILDMGGPQIWLELAQLLAEGRCVHQGDSSDVASMVCSLSLLEAVLRSPQVDPADQDPVRKLYFRILKELRATNSKIADQAARITDFTERKKRKPGESKVEAIIFGLVLAFIIGFLYWMINIKFWQFITGH